VAKPKDRQIIKTNQNSRNTIPRIC